MNFFDPERVSLVNPRELVKALTRQQAREHNLKVDDCALITVLNRDFTAFTKMLRGHQLKSWQRYREIYRGAVKHGTVTVALSPSGAPNVVALAEELATFGMEKALFFGYCGSLQEHIRAGDIIVPNQAIREEGTSFHYIPADAPSLPDQDMVTAIFDVFHRKSMPCHGGTVWTTDAIYRETPGKVAKYQRQGVLGVEMELSALFSFGLATKVKIAAILVVSDELSVGNWRPFTSSLRLLKGVRRARAIAVEVLNAVRQTDHGEMAT